MIAVAETREQIARPLPRRGGLRRARRRPRLLRGLRRRADDVPALPDLADLALADVEGADPVPVAPLPRRRRSIRAGTGSRTGRTTAEAYSYWEVMKDGRAVLEATGAETALLGGLCDGGGYALMLAATDPAVALGVAAISPSRPAPHARASELPPLSVDRAARHRRGLGQVERPLLAARLPRLPRVLLLAAAPRAALDEADRGLRPVGARRRRRVARPRRRGGPAAVRERGGGARPRRTRPLPGARRPRRARQLPDARARARRRGAHRRDVRRARGRGAHPDGAPPGEGERPAEGLRRLRRAARAEGEDVDARAQPPPPGALRLVADRARARAARRRDREGAAQAAPRPRDRLARAASGDGGARGRGRADPSGERAARERVGAHRERVAPSTTCTPSRRSGGWTRSSSRTSCSSSTSCARSTTTSGSATRPGRSTTSCTRTRS